jgi:transposase
MKRIPRAVYTVEYKVAAVHQVLGGKKAAEVARELGVVEQTLHNWIKAYRAGKLGDGTGKQVSLTLRLQSSGQFQKDRLNLEVCYRQ